MDLGLVLTISVAFNAQIIKLSVTNRMLKYQMLNTVTFYNYLILSNQLQFQIYKGYNKKSVHHTSQRNQNVKRWN